MDAHFSEYLAAVAGMQEVYGEPHEGQPTEFHEADAPAPVAEPALAVAAQA
jgi:hypothetical protein